MELDIKWENKKVEWDFIHDEWNGWWKKVVATPEWNQEWKQ